MSLRELLEKVAYDNPNKYKHRIEIVMSELIEMNILTIQQFKEAFNGYFTADIWDNNKYNKKVLSILDSMFIEDALIYANENDIQ